MKRFVSLAVSILLIGSGLGQTEGPQAPGENTIGAIDPVTEGRLGQLWMDEQFQDYERSTNKEHVRVVNEIGHRILDAINDRPELDSWEFVVLDVPTVNAVSFPGGKIVVFDGLIDLITTKGKIDQGMLAGVLAHEVAHAKLGHSLSLLRDRNGLKWALENMDRIRIHGAQGGLSEAEREKFLALVGARFGREQELEADMVGSFYAAVAGYGFDGGIRWTQLAQEKLGDFTSAEYVTVRTQGGRSAVADHPTWSERIAKMKEYQGRVLNIVGEFNWGTEMLRTRNFEKAAQCFRDVVKVFPKCFEAWNNLGIAYQKRFLSEKRPAELKYQTDLVDYLADLRERVRGPDDLGQSIDCFREALRQDQAAPGVRGNLATALALQTMLGADKERKTLGEADKMFDAILADEPANPQGLNGKAIVLCIKDSKSSKAEEMFSKAAGLDYLPAQYNLACSHLDRGREKEAMAVLTDYLKRDDFSVWADAARETLKAHQADVPPPAKPSGLPKIESILKVELDADKADVLKALKDPERLDKVTNPDDSIGEILWYDSLGLAVLISNEAVNGLVVFQPGMPHANALADDAFVHGPAPEVAGVSIGATTGELVKKLGKPSQMTSFSGSEEKTYSYGDGRVRIDFQLNNEKVFAVTVSRK